MASRLCRLSFQYDGKEGGFPLEIQQIFRNKKRFLPLLLLADEQENMVDRYLNRGEMFALYDDGKVKTIAVITREGEKLCELKNIATVPAY